MLSIVQVNLNRARAAHDLLETMAVERGVQVCLISEPNTRRVQDRPDWLIDRTGCAAVWWCDGPGSQETVRAKGEGAGFCWMELGRGVVIYSFYFSPNRTDTEFLDFLDALGASVETHGDKGIIATGDFNAAAGEWGSTRTTVRGRNLLDWMAQRDFTLLNDGRIPTFMSPTGRRSFIDLTMASGEALPAVREWEVLDEESGSDHRYISFKLGPRTFPCPTSFKRRWQYRKLDKEVLVTAIDEGCQRLAQESEADETRIMEVLVGACELSGGPGRQTGHRRQPVYWWSDEIAEARRRCNRLRRAYTRRRTWLSRRHLGDLASTASDEGDGTQTPLHEDPAALSILANLARAKKTLKDLIRQAKRQAWRELIDAVDKDPWGLPYQVVMKKLKRQAPRLPPDVIQEAVRELFPQHETRLPEKFQIKAEDIPEFTLTEVDAARERLATGKAPGPDGIPPEVARLSAGRHRHLFRDVANRLLREGRFPEIWKRASLVLIPKPGGKSYRPICLLDTMGKLLEHLLLRRLTDEIESKGALSDAQYGFRRGRSTLGALSAVIQTAIGERQRNLRTRKYVLLILLDVKNAFNSMNWKAAMDVMARRGISPYLRRIVGSYFSDRKLLAGGQEYQVTAGVPQGSVLGPTLWNLAYDGVLRLEMPPGVRMIAYADDLALLVMARSEDALELIANDALRRVSGWMTVNYLQLAPQKAEALYLTGRKRHRGIDLWLGGHRIDISRAAKYLGVYLDTALSGKAHLTYIRGKVHRVSSNLRRLMPRLGGPNRESRFLWALIADAVALYVAPVWGEMVIHTKTNRRALRSAQRRIAIGVTRAYRTVSTDALLVLAGLLPWDLLAKERAARYQDGDLDLTQARQATIVAWQDEWANSPADGRKGEWTRALIPDLQKWIDRGHGSLSYSLTQVLTGHGLFQAYLFRIGKAPSDICVLCDSGAVDDVEHTVLHCAALRVVRGADMTGSVHEIVAYMLGSVGAWEKRQCQLESIMTRKMELETARRARWGPVVRTQQAAEATPAS